MVTGTSKNTLPTFQIARESGTEGLFGAAIGQDGGDERRQGGPGGEGARAPTGERRRRVHAWRPEVAESQGRERGGELRHREPRGARRAGADVIVDTVDELSFVPRGQERLAT